MYGQFLRTKSSHSHFKYKIYRNKLVGLLRLSKKLYYRNYFIAIIKAMSKMSGKV